MDVVATVNWPEYLDRLEETALSVGQQAAAGEAPVWPVLARPPDPPPAHLSARLQEVLGLLAETETGVERCLQAVGSELAGLTRRAQAAGHRDGPVGGRFDVLG
jgi:hypothetical protein